MPRPTVLRSAAAAGIVLVVLLVSIGAATAQSTTTTADPPTTTTFDQSLTTTPPLDADHAPSYGSPDLDMDRITGPRVEDGVVTSTTFWPLGFAAVAILVVFGTIFYRAARGKKGNQATGVPDSD